MTLLRFKSTKFYTFGIVKYEKKKKKTGKRINLVSPPFPHLLLESIETFTEGLVLS